MEIESPISSTRGRVGSSFTSAKAGSGAFCCAGVCGAERATANASARLSRPTTYDRYIFFPTDFILWKEYRDLSVVRKVKSAYGDATAVSASPFKVSASGCEGTGYVVHIVRALSQ